MAVIRDQWGSATALTFSASEIGAPRRRCVEREHFEQVALFDWATRLTGRIPELALLYAIPNAGKRNKAAAGKLKAEGLKAGAPDMCLPVARGKYHGLYIELKAPGGKPTASQKAWLKALNEQGYCACLCVGWGEAKSTIENYLRHGVEG